MPHRPAAVDLLTVPSMVPADLAYLAAVPVAYLVVRLRPEALGLPVVAAAHLTLAVAAMVEPAFLLAALLPLLAMLAAAAAAYLALEQASAQASS